MTLVPPIQNIINRRSVGDSSCTIFQLTIVETSSEVEYLEACEKILFFLDVKHGLGQTTNAFTPRRSAILLRAAHPVGPRVFQEFAMVTARAMEALRTADYPVQLCLPDGHRKL